MFIGNSNKTNLNLYACICFQLYSNFKSLTKKNQHTDKFRSSEKRSITKQGKLINKWGLIAPTLDQYNGARDLLDAGIYLIRTN